jgi:ABC-type nitrate/sulfonate/bicarbonate transport system substrate-binding protein
MKYLIVFLSFLFCGYCVAEATLKIALDWTLNPHHTPFILADVNGYFKEEGISVSFHPASSSQEGCRLAAAGAYDFACTHEAQLFFMHQKNIHLIPVAYLIPTTLEVIISRVPYKDLKGKTLAHGSSGAGNLTHRVIASVLSSQGLTETDVTLLMAKNALMSGFLSKNIDVVFNAYKTYQIIDLECHTSEPFFVWELKEFGVPTFASLIVVAGPHVCIADRLKLERALQKAIDYIHKNPHAACAKMLNYRFELNTPENKRVWDRLYPLFADHVSPALYATQRHALEQFCKL